MKIALLFSLVLLVSCSSVRKVKRPIYWKTTYKGIEYRILGTMHTGFRLESLPEKIKKDIESSDLVAVEVVDFHKAAKKIATKSYTDYYKNIGLHYPQLLESLTPKTRDNLLHTLASPDVQKYLKNELRISYPPTEIHPSAVMGMTYDFIARQQVYVFRPELTQEWWEKQKGSHALGLEKGKFLDEDIVRFAKSEGKKVISLDDEDFSYNEIFRIDDAGGLRWIERFYGANFDLKAELRKLDEIQKLYMKGDVEGLAGLFKTFDPDMYGHLLINRNKHWFDELVTLDNVDTVFVAVGAGHLAGESNLLSYFEDRGAKIERVD